MIKKFYLKIAFFLLPLTVVIVPPFYILKHTGENFNNIDDVIKNNKKYLIGYLYSEKNYKYLKWKTITSHKKYNIMAIGSSRVLQFRSQMFETSFYNAGYTVSSISEFVPFLRSIPKEKYPNYLIINLDQWMFNENWDNLTEKNDSKRWSESFQKNATLTVMFNVWKDLYANKYSFQFPVNKSINKIGLNANVKNTGFRNDGSMLYGSQIKKLLANDVTASDFDSNETIKRVIDGRNRFEFGDNVNPMAIKELNALLHYCKVNKIKIIAFIPPFSNNANKKISQNKNHKYMDAIYKNSLPLFKKYNSELYDLSHLSSYNSNDSEIIDGFHGGEVTYIRMLIKILESNSVLKNVTNIEKLKLDLKNKRNNYQVY